MKKHIEITWSNGEKTVETYATDICLSYTTTAEDIFRAYRTMARILGVEPVSYRELD